MRLFEAQQIIEETRERYNYYRSLQNETDVEDISRQVKALIHVLCDQLNKKLREVHINS